MTDSDLFADLFNPRAILLPLNTSGRGKSFLLEEKAEGYETIIFGAPDDTIAIKLDESFDNNKIFNGHRGECKRADFLLFSESKERISA